jgi:carboxyl-terminal processing protease
VRIQDRVVAFGTAKCDYAKPLFPGMKLRLSAAVAALSLASFATPTLFAKSDLDNICVSVGRLLEEGHYTHKQLNDDLSRKILRTYIEILDFSHLFFTQEDVDTMNEKYGTTLDDDILLGNLKPAYEIYDLYQKRVDERVAKVKEQLKQPIDFKSNTTIDLSRQ